MDAEWKDSEGEWKEQGIPAAYEAHAVKQGKLHNSLNSQNSFAFCA